MPAPEVRRRDPCPAIGCIAIGCDGGPRSGVTSAEPADVVALRKENGELRRANEVLETASGSGASTTWWRSPPMAPWGHSRRP